MEKTFAAIALFLLITPNIVAADRPIDAARSKITIHVGKTGLFSAAGHEHEVSAPISEGAIDDSGNGRIWFRLEAAKMQVLPEKDQAAVQKDMQEKVLESANFPQIRFESTAIQKVANGKWSVTGNLSLHGKTNPVIAEVHAEGAGYAGTAIIKQSQFGIKPVSAAGGTVKVKDELKIDFVIVAQE
jgi:polyisoprenoid-binding protein YceI